MPDPLRFTYNQPDDNSRSVNPFTPAGQILYRSPLQRAMYLISKHELSAWFEPNWRDARILARRFPRCLICSIPEESDTPTLCKIPAWRRRAYKGVI